MYTLEAQELTKNAHTARCICYANHNIFHSGVFFEDIHLIIVDCLTEGSAVEDLEIHNDAVQVPVLNVVECGCCVACAIFPSSMITCPRSVELRYFHQGCPLCQCTMSKYCFSHPIF